MSWQLGIMPHICLMTMTRKCNHMLINSCKFWNLKKFFGCSSFGAVGLHLVDSHKTPCLKGLIPQRSVSNSYRTLYNLPVHHRNVSKLLTPVSLLRNDCRGYKGKKKKGGETIEVESSSESDTESGEDSDLDIESLGDDSDAPDDYQLMELNVKSLRVDNVVSGGLAIARNRAYEMFFANQLRLNGDKLTKKKIQLSVGDSVDIITEKLDNVVKIKRIKIVKVLSEKTRKDKFIVYAKVWKNPFEIRKTGKTKD